jgi:hypothetical protein
MIVEAFDNAWHILRHWAEVGHEYFVFEHRERVPEPRPVPREDLPPDAICGLDYFLVPALAPPAHGDNPDPGRPLTPAEILLATAIAEGWEPTNEGAS